MVRWLSRFFNYLDRYYIQRHNLHPLNDVGLLVFRGGLCALASWRCTRAVPVLGRARLAYLPPMPARWPPRTPRPPPLYRPHTVPPPHLPLPLHTCTPAPAPQTTCTSRSGAPPRTRCCAWWRRSARASRSTARCRRTCWASSRRCVGAGWVGGTGGKSWGRRHCYGSTCILDRISHTLATWTARLLLLPPPPGGHGPDGVLRARL